MYFVHVTVCMYMCTYMYSAFALSCGTADSLPLFLAGIFSLDENEA